MRPREFNETIGALTPGTLASLLSQMVTMQVPGDAALKVTRKRDGSMKVSAQWDADDYETEERIDPGAGYADGKRTSDDPGAAAVGNDGVPSA